MNDEDMIQKFLDSLKGETITGFVCLKWFTDPVFLISTDRRSFKLHSNDIGVYIDEETEI